MNLTPFRTLARKLTALSFIFLILIGHFYLLMVFFGQGPSLALQYGFLIGMAGAFAGGLLLFLLQIAKLFDAD